MGRELERKYGASPELLEQIRQTYGEFTEIQMKTRYFDTEARDFGARKWMLRLREENGVTVCTLKTRLPDGSRGEFEARAETVAEASPELLGQGAPAEAAALLKKGVREQCGAAFTRLAKTVPVPGGAVELALDWGAFTAGDRRQPFSEVEAELKSGDDRVLTAFTENLTARFPLREEPRSKAQRAFALISGSPG